jgi:hypothetical protein
MQSCIQDTNKYLLPDQILAALSADILFQSVCVSALHYTRSLKMGGCMGTAAQYHNAVYPDFNFRTI